MLNQKNSILKFLSHNNYSYYGCEFVENSFFVENTFFLVPIQTYSYTEIKITIITTFIFFFGHFLGFRSFFLYHITFCDFFLLIYVFPKIFYTTDCII